MIFFVFLSFVLCHEPVRDSRFAQYARGTRGQVDSRLGQAGQRPWKSKESAAHEDERGRFYAEHAQSQARKVALEAYRAKIGKSAIPPGKHLREAFDMLESRQLRILTDSAVWSTAPIIQVRANGFPLGVQLEAVASALLIAMLEKRAIITFAPVLATFETPFDRLNVTWSHRHSAFYAEADGQLRLLADRSDLSADFSSLACGGNITVASEDEEFDAAVLHPARVLRFSANAFIGMQLWRHPRARRVLERWFGPDATAGKMMGQLLQYLLVKPVERVEARLERFETHYMREKNTGMHIRLPKTDEPTRDHVEELAVRVARCVDKKLVPKARLTNTPLNFVVTSLYDVAKDLLSRAFGRDALVVFHSRKQEYEAIADEEREQLRHQNPLLRPNVRVRPAGEKLSDAEKMDLAVVEWLLLSRCDAMVLSYNTPFSRTAAAYGGVPPPLLVHSATLECEQIDATKDMFGDHYWLRPETQISCT